MASPSSTPVPEPTRGPSPAFTYISSVTENKNEALSASTSWARSPLWDHTHDEARFHQLVERHRDDPDWLFAELKVTRRRMHQSWSDNKELAARLEGHSKIQSALNEARHEIIDLKRERESAIRAKGDDAALLQRLRSRCEGLLVANERLEEFYNAAQVTESKWVTGLAECEQYMKQLCKQLDEAIHARDHYKKWAVDRTDQLREAEDTLTKMLAELRTTVQQRDQHKKMSEDWGQRITELEIASSEQEEKARADADEAKQCISEAQEKIVALKTKLAKSESARVEIQARYDDLENSHDKVQQALNSTKDILRRCEQSLAKSQEAKLSLEEDLKMVSEKAAVLEATLSSTNIELERVRNKSSERKSKIHTLTQEISEVKLSLDQSQWSVQSARLERDRDVADKERQIETLQIAHDSLREKHTSLQKAIEMAQAGAEAAAVARVVAKHEMATENAMREAAKMQFERQERKRNDDINRKNRENELRVSSLAVETELQARLRTQKEKQQQSRRSVLSNGVMQSLEKTVVDYALLSLSRSRAAGK